jgi:Tfp pilus assembly protein PilO
VLATPTAKWSAGTALACVVLIAATWFGLIAPRRGDAADLQAQRVSAQQSNALLQAKIQQLRAQFADLPRTQAELAALHQQLTPTADLPTLVRSISALATEADTRLVSIVPQAATALAGPAGQAGAAGQAGVSGAGTTAIGPAAGGAAAPAASRSGVVVIPLAIAVGGDYYQVVGFVRKLQTEMSRAVLLTSLQIDQDSSFGVASGVRLSLVGDVFALPVATTGAALTTAGSR